MGAITRAAANNITTGGVILPSAINDASVASVSSLAQVNAGDGITLISSQTASASASISFTSGIDSTYRTYLFKFINMHPATDNIQFQFNFSTDGGSNYNVTKTTTHFFCYHNEGGTDTNLAYDTNYDLAQSTAYQSITAGVGADADQCVTGYLYLFSPSSTTYVKNWLSDDNYTYSNDYSINIHCGGYANTTSAINAIDFKFASGNIDAGTIYMYGIA